MSEARQKIDLNMTTTDLMVLMAEGNPGALSVLMQLLQTDPVGGIGAILSLDDMNIRGEQVWLGYKDYAGEDINAFVRAVNECDRAMIDTINQNSSKETAVVCGASFER